LAAAQALRAVEDRQLHLAQLVAAAEKAADFDKVAAALGAAAAGAAANRGEQVQDLHLV
jgi:hypothetical protein